MFPAWSLWNLSVPMQLWMAVIPAGHQEPRRKPAARLTVCTSARDTWVSHALTFSHKTERVNENCRRLHYVWIIKSVFKLQIQNKKRLVFKDYSFVQAKTLRYCTVYIFAILPPPLFLIFNFLSSSPILWAQFLIFGGKGEIWLVIVL